MALKRIFKKRPHIDGQLIFLKGTNEIQQRKNSLSIYGAAYIGHLYAMNFNPYLEHYTKIYSKSDHRCKCKT